MNTVNNAIVDKIKKLLALSKSANEHEAILALQRAQELMEKHGISSIDVELSDVNESAVTAGTSNNMPRWLCRLAHVVADAFGVQWFQSSRLGENKVVFVGIDAYAEISSYAFTVLRRQLVKARKAHLDGISKRFKRANRIRKADIFAMAWVHTVDSKVVNFAASVKTEELINTYMAKHHSGLVTFTPKSQQAKPADFDDMGSGYIAARDVTLNHGMRSADRQKAIA